MMTEDERAYAKAYELAMFANLVGYQEARLSRLIATSDLDRETSVVLTQILNGLTHAHAEAKQAAIEEIQRQRAHDHKSPVPASISEHSHADRIHPG